MRTICFEYNPTKESDAEKLNDLTQVIFDEFDKNMQDDEPVWVEVTVNIVTVASKESK